MSFVRRLAFPGTRPEPQGANDLIHRLGALWRDGVCPDVLSFLLHNEVDDVHVMLRIVMMDQRKRWERGERVPASSYLEAFPEFRVDSEIAFDLVWSEYLIRESLGDSPDLEEYVRCFPEYEPLLRRQHEVHRWVDRMNSSELLSESRLALLGEAWSGFNSECLARARDWKAEHDERPFLIPGFEVLGKIGCGGMGVVYRARQLSLNRDVALKVMAPAYAADSKRLRRFHNEAAIAARLTNSRVLPVFDVLEAGGAPVLVMPFVDGWDLARILADRRAVKRGEPVSRRHPSSSFTERTYLDFILPVLDQIVAAVASVHEAGVLHRDIKPSNVLIDRCGDVRLTDFGLARLIGRTLLTEDNQRMGTPGFMSPEQWVGGVDNDQRTDVFGLGATLYSLLTLELPYKEQQISRHSPPPSRPSKRNGLLSGEIDAVIIKALEPDRRNRYRTAGELQEDWRRARSGLLPSARCPGPFERLFRWVRRHSWLVARAAVVVVMLSLGALAMMRTGRTSTGSLPPRRVNLISNPPGAGFVLVPLDDTSGELIPDRAIRPADHLAAPSPVLVPPGDYLVVAVWRDGRFHEVYRHVPHPGERPGWDRAQRWIERSGVIELYPVDAPPPDVLAGMTYFETNRGIAGKSVAEHPGRVASDGGPVPYYLDPHEITVQEYLRVAPGLRDEFKREEPGANDAVRYVTFDEALNYIEKLGKRLPDEAEYEFAATGGGSNPFPSDDPAPYLGRRTWPFGPVGEPGYDRTATEPPVFGLYSNVAEWTSSWFTPGPDLPRVSLSGEPARMRVIRGGPPSVILGKPLASQFGRGPRFRVGQSRSNAWLPGVGFRGARSVRPRFMPKFRADR